MSDCRLLIVIPAYNEERNLRGLLPQIDRVATDSGHKPEIIVVDDGSQDGTASVVKELSKGLAVHLVSHQTNLGAACAFITGLRAAIKSAGPDDVIALMEADQTNDPDLLPEMIRRIENGDDLVIGSRYESGGSYRGFPLRRLILSMAANASLRLIFSVPGVCDYTIFYRAYRASVLSKGFRVFGENLIESRTFVCNAELLIKLNMIQTLRISEVPLIYRYDLKQGRSKMPVAKTFWEYFSFVRRMRRLEKSTGGKPSGATIEVGLKD